MYEMFSKNVKQILYIGTF